MKILSIGNFSGRGWDGSITDENHIADALESLGHEVTRLQREQSFDTLPGGDVDFILMAQWDGYHPMTIPNLKIAYRPYEAPGEAPPIIYWSFDYQADGQEWHEKLIANSDLYLSKRIADSKYPNWQWLSQDFAPEFLHKAEPITKDIDVLFTGSYIPWAAERNKTLKAVDEKFNLVIHSVNAWDGFNNVRPAILDEGLPELYARAKIILSIDHTIEAGYWSDRNAQIICCGRRPLFRYVPLSEATFHDDVDYFYSIDDCLRQIERRLKPSYIEYVATKALQQGLYKVNRRVKDLLTIVNAYLHV
jgi:hypothetical protein